MKEFLDNLENAAFELKDKAIPAIQRGLDRAADEVKAAYEKAKPKVEDHLERAKDACEKMAPKVREGFERAVIHASDALNARNEAPQDAPGEADEEAPEPAKNPSLEEQFETDVQRQVEQVRAARSASSPFSQYLSEKYKK